MRPTVNTVGPYDDARFVDIWLQGLTPGQSYVAQIRVVAARSGVPSGMDRNHGRTLLASLTLFACGPDKAEDTPASTGDASTGTSTPTTGDSETAGLNCEPGTLPACPATQCLQDWTYSCGECGDFVADSTCFKIKFGCAYPALDCDLPRPCGRVWGQGYQTIEGLEDNDAALCLLMALRDGTPGEFEVLWGEMGDAPLVYMTVYSGGTGNVLVEWFIECEGCPNSGAFRRSGQLALRPKLYFDDCLAAPDTLSLTQCVFGFVDFMAGMQPPADYTPPFTTGECVGMDISCPK